LLRRYVDDSLIFIDVPHLNGFLRRWFLRVWIGEELIFPVLGQSFLTTPTGSLQTTNGGVDASWNNRYNKIEVIGAGGAGAHGASTTTGGGGGGGGAYNAITNFTITTPGTTTFSWEVGTGGAAGGTFPQNGGDTWWNAAAFPTTGTAVGARGGASPTTNTTATGGAGGLASNGFPTTSPPGRNGGTAGNGASATAGGGGGGAGGPSGVGGNGSGTTGGTADGGVVAGGSPGNPGTSNSGTEFNATHGCGSGAGGSNASGGTGGPGGLYGGGAGGGSRSTGVGGSGAQGIIVLTWFPQWPFDVVGSNEGLFSPTNRGSRRGPGVSHKSGFLSPVFQRSGWEIQSVQPPHPFREKRGAIVPKEDGIEFPFVPPRLTLFETTPPLLKRVYALASSALRHRTGFVSFPWLNSGWEIQSVQPPHPFREKRGAVVPKEDGIEFPFVPPATNPFGYDLPIFVKYTRHVFAYPDTDTRQGYEFPFINWINAGWEIQYRDIRNPKYRSPDTGDQGIEFPFIQFINPGGAFQITTLLPKFLPKARTVPNSGEDGTEFPYSRWINAGWEVQYRDIKRVVWRSPDTGDQGIEARFQQWINAGWEVQYRDVKHPVYRSPDTGDQGIESPFSQWVNLGWPVQFWDIRNPKYRTPDVGDQGIQSPFSQWLNSGWEIQYRDIKHPKYNSPDVGDQGIENTFTAVVVTTPPAGWEFQQVWYHKRYTVPDPQMPGAEYIPFINWQNYGWDFQITTLLPKYLPKVRTVPNSGDDGIEFPFSQWRNGGWEPVLHNLPHRWFKSPDTGDQGVQSPFQQWRNAGWEIQYRDLVHRFFKSPDTGDQGIEFPFINWQNAGWAVQYLDLVHKFFKSPEFGDQGIESPFILWQNLGWPTQYGDVLHRLFKSPDIGDSGIELPFVPPAPSTSPWGFDPVSVFQRTLRLRSPDIGDQGIQAQFINWINAGGQATLHQPQHRRFISLDNGDTGIELPFVPPVSAFVGWGFEPTLLYHRALRLRSPEFGDQGIQSTFQQWINSGWPIQYQDLPHRGHPAGGIFWKSGFAPSSTLPLSFIPQWADIVHRWYKTPDTGNSGIQAAFVQWVNQGWGPVWADIVHRYFHSPEYGDSGIEAGFINWLNMGWEIAPPPPPANRVGLRATSFNIGDSGIEFIYFPPVVAPLPPWAFDPVLPPASQIQIAGRHFAALVGGSGLDYPLFPFVPPTAPRYFGQRQSKLMKGLLGQGKQ
jgi:hypothetical protein